MQNTKNLNSPLADDIITPYECKCFQDCDFVSVCSFFFGYILRLQLPECVAIICKMTSPHLFNKRMTFAQLIQLNWKFNNWHFKPPSFENLFFFSSKSFFDMCVFFVFSSLTCVNTFWFWTSPLDVFCQILVTLWVLSVSEPLSLQSGSSQQWLSWLSFYHHA